MNQYTDKSRKILTEKQKKFCQEYMIDFNATQAAIRAGYKNTNAVGVTAYENLRKPYIQEYLQGLLQKQAEKAEISVQWIIQELKQMYEKCQNSLSTPGIMANATRQLELLGKYLGMWIDRSEMTIKIEEVKKIIIQITEVVKKYVPDPIVRNRIAKGLKEIGL